MGTNYYLHRNVCPHCGRGDEPLHIGKSSAGWCFSLHVYPEDGIHDLDDWRKLLPGSAIKDEYGTPISDTELLEVITSRAGQTRDRCPMGYASWEQFYAMNHATVGPGNLVRHALDGRFCIKHGSGTWDCLIGEFS